MSAVNLGEYMEGDSHLYVSEQVISICHRSMCPELKKFILEEERRPEKCWSVRRIWSPVLYEQLKQHKGSNFSRFSKCSLLQSFAKSVKLIVDNPYEGVALYVNDVIVKTMKVSLFSEEYRVAENYSDRDEMRTYCVTFVGKLARCIAHNVHKDDILAIWGASTARKCYGGWLLSADSTKMDSIIVVIFRPEDGSYESFIKQSNERMDMDISEGIGMRTWEIDDNIGCFELAYVPFNFFIPSMSIPGIQKEADENFDPSITLNDVLKDAERISSNLKQFDTQYFQL